jgi:hypothetical protein
MYQIVLEYDDGREAVVERTVDELADATVFAIDLADRAGHYHGDGHGRPRWVKIFDGDQLEIAISVVPNGLLSPSDVRRSFPT